MRANLVSCALDTVAACLVFRTVLALCPDRPRAALPAAVMAGVRSAASAAAGCAAYPPPGGGCCAQVLFALSPIVWLYAVGSEVFALNNALCAAVLLQARATRVSICIRVCRVPLDLCLSECGASPQAAASVRGGAARSDVAFGALLSGLAMSNQHTSALFIIPLMGRIVWLRRRVRVGSPGAWWHLVFTGGGRGCVRVGGSGARVAALRGVLRGGSDALRVPADRVHAVAETGLVGGHDDGVRVPAALPAVGCVRACRRGRWA